MPKELTMSPSDFAALLTKGQQKTSAIQAQLGRMNNAASSALSALPASVASAVTSILDQINDMINKFLVEVYKFFTEPGNPGKLYQAGSDWTDLVGNPVGGRSACLQS